MKRSYGGLSIVEWSGVAILAIIIATLVFAQKSFVLWYDVADASIAGIISATVATLLLRTRGNGPTSG
ncbi:MAG: hypothetical protein ABEK59_01170 [Halobacteria archaeon]